MSTPPQLQVEPIPTPPDFPVVWENPADAHLFWFRENVHFPDPIKPLDFALCIKGIEAGFSRAAHHYGIPGETYDRLFNTYVYEAMEPPPGSPEEVEAQLKQAQETLDAIMPQLDDLWRDQWLPEIKELLSGWEAYNLQDATLAELASHLQESQTNLFRLWEIHFLLFFPMVLAISLFDELYQELFADSDPLAAYGLLAGFPNKTIESDLALWNLSRQALDLPEVVQIFRDYSPAIIKQELAEHPAGQRFLTDLEAYLQYYGRRGDRWSVLAIPWVEDPTPVLKSLQEYIAQPTRDLAAEMQNKVTLREQAVAATKAQLTGYPQPVIREFELRLKSAQIGYTLKEEHAYWIDFLGIYQVRCVCLALGQRLVEAGLIEKPEDVFYLSVDELAVVGTTDQPEYQPLIEERRATEAHFATITPPPALGSSAPEMEADDPISRAVGKVMGGPPPDEAETASAAELRGAAGSSGVVQGVAKVLHSLDEAQHLTQGDILVASMTTPSWTPLFATAGAVVTDGGGVLSHAAIVAREYGIPAVVNTGEATSLLRDGQRIEVDGNQGIVRILAS